MQWHADNAEDDDVIKKLVPALVPAYNEDSVPSIPDFIWKAASHPLHNYHLDGHPWMGKNVRTDRQIYGQSYRYTDIQQRHRYRPPELHIVHR